MRWAVLLWRVLSRGTSRTCGYVVAAFAFVGLLAWRVVAWRRQAKADDALVAMNRAKHRVMHPQPGDAAWKRVDELNQAREADTVASLKLQKAERVRDDLRAAVQSRVSPRKPDDLDERARKLGI